MTRRTKTLLLSLLAGFVLLADVPWNSSVGAAPTGKTCRVAWPRPKNRARVCARVGVRAEVPATTLYLPVPPEFEPRARLWEAVYGEYDSTQVILYNREHPEIIYEAVPSLPGRKERAAREIRERLMTLNRIARKSADPEAELAARDDGGELLALYHQFDGTRDVGRFAAAAGPGAISSMRGKRDGLIAAYGRASFYLPRMEREFALAGVPRSLTRLVFVESMFDREALSDKGAYGPWQILPEAGERRLAMNYAVDERRDPVASSRAAARILADNYKLLGTWPLAVTAYNAGAPRMERELRRTGSTHLAEVLGRSRHRAFGFCVNNFYLQLVGVVRAERRLGLTPEVFDPTYDPYQYDEVELPGAVSVSFLAGHLGMTIETLNSYNPAWTSPVENNSCLIPAGYRLRVPAGSGPIVAEALGIEPPTTTALADTEGE